MLESEKKTIYPEWKFLKLFPYFTWKLWKEIWRRRWPYHFIEICYYILIWVELKKTTWPSPWVCRIMRQKLERKRIKKWKWNKKATWMKNLTISEVAYLFAYCIATNYFCKWISLVLYMCWLLFSLWCPSWID